MKTPGQDTDTPDAAQSRDELDRLAAQVASTRAVLVRLLQDVLQAEKQLGHSELEQVVAVNEQLVVSAIASQDLADTAAAALQEANASARLDVLTGLANRGLLLERFGQAIASAKRHGKRCALMFMDIDHFKALNDRYGHAFGDDVLKRVAGRLQAAVRAVDTVSRHGGDEFLVLLAELNQPEDAKAVAGKLIAAVGAPAEIAGKPVRISVSVGTVVYPDDGKDLDTLVALADAAMYQAKRHRAGRVVAHGEKASADAAPADGQVDATGAPSSRSTALRGAGSTEQQLATLREANEQLVLAAMDAHELLSAAEQARLRQAAFLASVATELRDPQAPIRIAAAMLGRPVDEVALLPRVEQIVGLQAAEISRLVEAVNVEIGGVQLEHVRVDLSLIVDRAVAEHRSDMDERGQRFVMQRPPGPIEVVGDSERLQQAVSNLLDNAVRYTHDGGRIVLALECHAGDVTLTLTDNGIGIARDLLPQVFEPFVQDPRALGLSGVGLGVGLTAARALVRAHGGRITAHSDGASRGCRFVVTLPLAEAAPAVTPKGPQ